MYMRFSTRQIAMAGLFSALTLVMGFTNWGFIPIPIPLVGAATTMQIPVILAGIFAGPGVGAAVGLLFGVFTLRFLGDFRVVIPARLLIGVVAWLVFAAVRSSLPRVLPRTRVLAAAALAGLLGAATNTVGTLFLATVFGYLTPAAAWVTGLTVGTPEALFTAVVVALLVAPLQRALP